MGGQEGRGEFQYSASVDKIWEKVNKWLKSTKAVELRAQEERQLDKKINEVKQHAYEWTIRAEQRKRKKYLSHN